MSSPGAPEENPLAYLPNELFDQICSYLSAGAKARLSATCKALHQKTQNPLYHHATVLSLAKLQLLTRTLIEVRGDYDRHGQLVHGKNIRILKCTINAKTEGSQATAAVLGRTFSIIAKSCPYVDIHFYLYNATCGGQPVFDFGTAVFPRITKLVLHTSRAIEHGARAPTEITPVVLNSRSHLLRSRDRSRTFTCSGHSEYWAGFFNGSSFPDLTDFSLHHAPAIAALVAPQKLSDDDARGLTKITRLVLERCPELTSSILLSALPYATNLTHLVFKNLQQISYQTLAEFLPHALPRLSHFTLTVPPDHPSADTARTLLDSPPDSPPAPHLCPLLRDHAHSLTTLTLSLPHICRALFLTEPERQTLHGSGIPADIASARNAARPGHRVDRVSLTACLRAHRELESKARVERAVRERVDAAGGGLDENTARYEVHAAETARARRIAAEGWRRDVACTNRLCRSYESWEELGVLAGLGESGVVWRLGYEPLNTAGVYEPGKVPVEGTYDEMFRPSRDVGEWENVRRLRAWTERERAV